MPAAHYRLRFAFLASVSLLLAGCAASLPVAQPRTQPVAAATPPSPPGPAGARAAAGDRHADIDTEATILTVLGLAKERSVRQPGPQTGSTVSPIMWQAALDTLNFTKFSSEDPLSGQLVTDWYSPRDKPDERFKISVFVLSRTLRSDGVAVTVDRQQRSAEGVWVPTTIARKVEDDLEWAILRRAGQLKRAWTKQLASD